MAALGTAKFSVPVIVAEDQSDEALETYQVAQAVSGGSRRFNRRINRRFGARNRGRGIVNRAPGNNRRITVRRQISVGGGNRRYNRRALRNRSQFIRFGRRAGPRIQRRLRGTNRFVSPSIQRLAPSTATPSFITIAPDRWTVRTVGPRSTGAKIIHNGQTYDARELERRAAEQGIGPTVIRAPRSIGPKIIIVSDALKAKARAQSGARSVETRSEYKSLSPVDRQEPKVITVDPRYID